MQNIDEYRESIAKRDLTSGDGGVSDSNHIRGGGDDNQLASGHGPGILSRILKNMTTMFSFLSLSSELYKEELAYEWF